MLMTKAKSQKKNLLLKKPRFRKSMKRLLMIKLRRNAQQWIVSPDPRLLLRCLASTQKTTSKMIFTPTAAGLSVLILMLQKIKM